jgi:hypothetical protein
MIVTYKNINIEIEQDVFAENPIKAFDYLGTLYYNNRNYKLTNNNYGNNYHCRDLDKLLQYFLLEHTIDKLRNCFENCNTNKAQKAILILASKEVNQNYIFIADSFQSDEDRNFYFDFVYFCKKGAEGLTDKQIYSVLQGELKEFLDYCNGDVLEYSIPIINDYCGGFYGTDFENNGLMEYAKNSIDYYLQEQEALSWNKFLQIDYSIAD